MEGGEGERYVAEARIMEKGYSLKSLMAASLVEAFLRDGDLEESIGLFGIGRLIGNGEALWKVD